MMRLWNIGEDGRTFPPKWAKQKCELGAPQSPEHFCSAARPSGSPSLPPPALSRILLPPPATPPNSCPYCWEQWRDLVRDSTRQPVPSIDDNRSTFITFVMTEPQRERVRSSLNSPLCYRPRWWPLGEAVWGWVRERNARWTAGQERPSVRTGGENTCRALRETRPEETDMQSSVSYAGRPSDWSSQQEHFWE